MKEISKNEILMKNSTELDRNHFNDNNTKH